MSNPIGPPTQASLDRHRAARHKGCLACGGEHVGGMRLHCRVQPGGLIVGDFEPQAWMSGYDGRMHGGMVAMVLDSAMTQCLFAHDLVGVTAVLHTRFRKPAMLNYRYRVEARLTEYVGYGYRLTANLLHGDDRIADAEAQFVPEA